MNQIINILTQQALPGLATLLLAIGTYLATRVTGLIIQRVKNPVVRDILLRIEGLASTIVAEVEGTLVDGIRTNGAPLTKAQSKALLDAALAKLRTHLGPQGLAEIEDAVRPGDLNALLVSYLEAANQKAGASVVVKP